jgi:hypothetical protein
VYGGGREWSWTDRVREVSSAKISWPLCTIPLEVGEVELLEAFIRRCVIRKPVIEKYSVRLQASQQSLFIDTIWWRTTVARNVPRAHTHTHTHTHGCQAALVKIEVPGMTMDKAKGAANTALYSQRCNLMVSVVTPTPSQIQSCADFGARCGFIDCQLRYEVTRPLRRPAVCDATTSRRRRYDLEATSRCAPINLARDVEFINEQWQPSAFAIAYGRSEQCIAVTEFPV